MKLIKKTCVLVFASALLLSGCGGNNNGKGKRGDDGFEFITDLDEVKDIHTDLQQEYLDYSGEYKSMPKTMYPDGDQLISDSLPVELEWDYDAGDDLVNYQVMFGQEEDLSDGYTVTFGKNPKAKLQNVFLGTNYFKVIANYGDDYTEESNIYSFKVDDDGPRNLAIDKMTNCRDMGGRKTTAGGTIKQGLLYRTSGNKFDYSTKISDEGKKEMLEHLKVKTEINLSNDDNYNMSLEGTTVKSLYMDYDTTGANSLHHLSRNCESAKNFIKMLADMNNYPMFFHCRIGTDRTGLCAILTYGLLGLDMNLIYQDYLFSNFGNIQQKRNIGDNNQDDITKYISQIEELPGKDFQEKVYNFLLSAGLTRETLDKVIKNLTDGPTPNGNSADQAITLANNFTLAGGATLKTDSSERNNPDYYVELGSGQTISATANITKARKAEIVAYVGYGKNDSNKVSEAIKVKVDGKDVSVTTRTMKEVGMGNCSNRVNYYPIILAKDVDLAAGNHTVTFERGSVNTNIASICVL